MSRCFECHRLPATHFCSQCVDAKYCSIKCQSKAWTNHHSVSCFLISGQTKRLEPSANDEELEKDFLKMVAEMDSLTRIEVIILEKLSSYERLKDAFALERQSLAEKMEFIFGQMSESFRERNEHLLPCHDAFDSIDLASVSTRTPDNLIYLMYRNIKHCFTVDSLYRIIRDNKRARHPITNEPLTDVQYAKIQEAAEIRIEAEENRVYFEGNADSLKNLMDLYQMDWTVEKIRKRVIEYESFKKFLSQKKELREVFDGIIDDLNTWSRVLETSVVRINHPKAENIFTNVFPDPESISSLKIVVLHPGIWPSIVELHNLTVIDLKNNGLQIFPPELLKITHLKVLILQKNYIETLPSNFANLKNLEILDLTDNKFDIFPKEIFMLTNLEKLSLAWNRRIDHVPKEIGNLTKLTELYLGFTRITEIPPEIGKLTNLERLDLSRNEYLEKIPAELMNLENLIQVDLEDGNDLIPIGDLAAIEIMLKRNRERKAALEHIQ